MSLRTVVHEGTVWTVWDVVRTLDIALVPIPDSACAEWLCFQCEAEKRRIAPAPPGWATWTDEALIRALRAAPVVQATGFVPTRSARPDAAESDQARHHRFSETMERARELDARVRRAMVEGGAKALADEGAEPPPPMPLPGQR